MKLQYPTSCETARAAGVARRRKVKTPEALDYSLKKDTIESSRSEKAAAVPIVEIVEDVEHLTHLSDDSSSEKSNSAR